MRTHLNVVIWKKKIVPFWLSFVLKGEHSNRAKHFGLPQEGVKQCGNKPRCNVQGGYVTTIIKYEIVDEWKTRPKWGLKKEYGYNDQKKRKFEVRRIYFLFLNAIEIDSPSVNASLCLIAIERPKQHLLTKHPSPFSFSFFFTPSLNLPSWRPELLLFISVIKRSTIRWLDFQIFLQRLL